MFWWGGPCAFLHMACSYKIMFWCSPPCLTQMYICIYQSHAPDSLGYTAGKCQQECSENQQKPSKLKTPQNRPPKTLPLLKIIRFYTVLRVRQLQNYCFNKVCDACWLRIRINALCFLRKTMVVYLFF